MYLNCLSIKSQSTNNYSKHNLSSDSTHKLPKTDNSKKTNKTNDAYNNSSPAPTESKCNPQVISIYPLWQKPHIQTSSKRKQ